MNIFILDTPEGTICVNSDNEENDQILLDNGAIKLSEAEIIKYGMKGYEKYVSPDTTKVNKDGSVTFTQPTEKDVKDKLFDNLRYKRNILISETDYLLTNDYPIDSNTLEKVKTYRKALRDITKLEGAPWDGGGKETPWPVQDF